MKNNQFSLNVVDSYFVFIISKKALNHLKLVAIDENLNGFDKYVIEEIAKTDPVVTRFQLYNKVKANETYCLQPECNNIYDKFVVNLNFEKDSTGDSLVNSLKYMGFYK